MALTLAPNPWFTGFDDEGNIVPGGKLFTYAAGTSTKKATYTDVLGQFANTNPIILDDAGRVPSGLFLLPSSYKFILAPADDTDPPGNPIRTQDNIGSVPSGTVNVDIQGLAGEALPAESVVYLARGTEGGTVAGSWYLADADAQAKSSDALTIGMVPTAIASGSTGTIRLEGDVDLSSTVLTPGAAYYVSATAGGVTATAPANTRYVGQASSVSVLTIVPNPVAGGLDLLQIEALLG